MSQTILEQSAALAAERRQRAAVAYFELLSRNDYPRGGDAEALSDAMAILGRSAAGLQGDLQLVQRITQCKALAADLPRLQSEAIAAAREWADACAWREKARKELEEQVVAKVDPAEAAKVNSEVARNEARHAGMQLPDLFRQWRAAMEGVDIDMLRVEARRNAMANGGRNVSDPTPTELAGRAG